MSAIVDHLDEEVSAGATCAQDEDVLVVTVHRRTPGAIVPLILDLIEDGRCGSGYRGPVQAVVDIRDACFAPSGQEVRLGALRLGRLEDRGRIALVVADDFQFGLGRMFGLLSEDTGIDVRPFREPAEAGRWVRADDDAVAGPRPTA